MILEKNIDGTNVKIAYTARAPAMIDKEGEEQKEEEEEDL